MSFKGAPRNCDALILQECERHSSIFSRNNASYAKTPDKKVEARVKALSACDSSPCRGGPAGWFSMFCFEIRKPAPRSVFFLFIAVDILDVLISNQHGPTIAGGDGRHLCGSQL